jgi:catechol 2,3-dioxygenase-like lactoylglutathione lyase family enzyme
MDANATRKFDVGGVLLDRPFRISRLGHFGYYTDHMDAARRFYVELLGFQISDKLDLGKRVKDQSQLAGLGDANGYFTRYGTDHHAFVLFPRQVMELLRGKIPAEINVNQITWQVGSLKQVVDANYWMQSVQVPIFRSGRDMPGSNWHTYMQDPENNRNELYYGMEQVGWEGYSKPLPMHKRGFEKVAELPQISEFQEVEQALGQGVDLESGYRYRETLPFNYEVDGIMLPRPFKITAIGPVRLLSHDVAKSVEFYRARLGFEVSEEVEWRGHRCVFLRANTEHHCLAIYPHALGAALDLPHQAQCMSFGVRLNDYKQLKQAIAFLKENGVKIIHLPPELFPGMDYTAFAVDPDGHLVQLYAYMEQIGWDGRPRPTAQRRKVDNNAWPETLEPMSDSFRGEPYLGPWA